MKRLCLLIAAALAGLTGCQTNPLGTANTPSVALPFKGISEINTGDVVFYATSASAVGTDLLFPSGGLSVGCGGASKVYAGPSMAIKPIGTYGTGGAALLLGPTAWLCPSGNCSGTPDYRGVGGLNGDFANDFFVRYAGVKGPDPSNDYSSMQMKFSASGATPNDLSAYRGIVFWARGHGNFAVNLVGRKPGDGLSPPNPPDAPYADWNFYLRRFGAELSGDVQWKEVIVYFSDMVQEYGLAVDLDNVKRKATGLQFDQQAPYTSNFQLDLDYVRLFK